MSFAVINGGMKFVSEGKEYAPGSFCWADLVAKEVGVAKDFYTSLFGWTFEDRPVMDEAVYTMFSKDGKQVCAMFEMFPGMLESGHPSFWQSYVTVESADEAVKKAVELGGHAAQEPCDVLDVGRMAMIRDPGEAFLRLWQPKAHKGAEVMNEPGAINWNELLTKDVERAGSFYAELFGWTSTVTPNPPGRDYMVFMSGEEPRAGMLELQPDMGEMPPHWGCIFRWRAWTPRSIRRRAWAARARSPRWRFPTWEESAESWTRRGRASRRWNRRWRRRTRASIFHDPKTSAIDCAQGGAYRLTSTGV